MMTQGILTGTDGACAAGAEELFCISYLGTYSYDTVSNAVSSGKPLAPCWGFSFDTSPIPVRLSLMVDSYYERRAAFHVDGTPIFRNRADAEAESRIAAALAEAWRCEINSFGECALIDWYAARDGRVVGLIEVKSRSHTSLKYPTVFLNVRKWLSLMQASAGLRCPAIFAVGFQDGILWIPLTEVDASVVRIAGCTRFVKSVTDVEPVIEVPLIEMRKLPT